MEIELPDGTVLEAPDGADPRAVVSGYRTRQAARSALADSTPMQRFGVGVAAPFVEMGKGLKSLAGAPVDLSYDDQGNLVGTDSGKPALDDEDKDVITRMSQVKGGAATAGRVVGEGAMLAVPGGTVVRAGAGLPWAAAYGADIAANAGMEALKAPNDEESRTHRAVEGAIGTMGGQFFGTALKALANGVKPLASDLAKRFLDDGIPLTPGQMAGGGVQTAEQMLAKLPFVGSAVRARQGEALSAWNKNILNDASPGDSIVTAAGQLGQQQLKKNLGDAYDLIWNTPTQFHMPSLRNSWHNVVDDAAEQLAPEGQAVVTRTLKNIYDNDLMPSAPKGADSWHVGGAALQAADKNLGAAASDAARAGNGDVANFLTRARSDFRDQLPDSMRQQLNDVNGQYAQFKVAQRAQTALQGAGAAPAMGGSFTPAQLLAASRALDRSQNKALTAQGRAVLQPQAMDAAQVFAKNTGEPASVTEKLATAIPGIPLSVLYSKTGMNLLTGRNPLQRGAQAVANNPKAAALSDAISQYLRSGQFGTALVSGESNN